MRVGIFMDMVFLIVADNRLIYLTVINVLPQNAKVVRIDYWVEETESGVHFSGNVLHTNSQMRRARCWFPCVDSYLQQCWYGLFYSYSCLL